MRTDLLQTTALGKEAENSKGHQQDPVGLLLDYWKSIHTNGVRLILKLIG